MKDDIYTAFSDIFPDDVLESLRKIVRNKNIDIDDTAIEQIIELLRLASNSKPALRQRIQRKIGFPVLDKLLTKFSSPDKTNWNESIFSEREMHKIKKSLYRFYPTLSKDELKERKTIQQLSAYLLRETDSFGSDIFPELSEYWDYLSSLDSEIIKELFSDTNKLRTHLTALKGETHSLVYARQLINSLPEIIELFQNLRFSKMVKSREQVLTYLLQSYRRLASFYEKFSKYVLIDMKIVEGKYNSKKNYMGLSLFNIKDSFLASEKYKSLGEINTTVRNSIAHESYIIMESTHRVRFVDRSVQEDHEYEELLRMTKRLGILLSVIIGHSNRGYLLEFEILSQMTSENKKTL